MIYIRKNGRGGMRNKRTGIEYTCKNKIKIKYKGKSKSKTKS